MNPFRRRSPWMQGNQIDLLENGEEFFPAVFEAIAAATSEVLIETFILWEDKVGLELQRVLIDAARRGVRIDLGVDGWGSVDLSDSYVAALVTAGVQVRGFDPKPRFLGMRLHMFRRMHRKIVVVDRHTAFVGGINFSGDHLADFGPEGKHDWSVRVRGPLVARIWRFAADQLPRRQRPRGEITVDPAGPTEAMFVVRDNHRHRNAIEREYRAAIRVARREVYIANAYFFPGYRLMKALRRAARRGVRVVLILQGQPDMPIVRFASKRLYPQLVRAGVEIHEYCQRPLHGKVALIDDNWATVGSSNLDPLSLSFNLEANVMVRDAAFNQQLRERLDLLVAEHCRFIKAEDVQRRSFWQIALDTIAFHATRHFPVWAGLLPAHVPRLAPLRDPPPAAAPAPAEAATGPSQPPIDTHEAAR